MSCLEKKPNTSDIKCIINNLFKIYSHQGSVNGNRNLIDKHKENC